MRRGLAAVGGDRAVVASVAGSDLPDIVLVGGVVHRLGQVEGDAGHQDVLNVTGESRGFRCAAVVAEVGQHRAGERDVLGGEQDIEIGELPGAGTAVETGFHGDAVQRGRGEPGRAERHHDPGDFGAVDAGRVLIGAQRGGQEAADRAWQVAVEPGGRHSVGEQAEHLVQYCGLDELPETSVAVAERPVRQMWLAGCRGPAQCPQRGAGRGGGIAGYCHCRGAPVRAGDHVVAGGGMGASSSLIRAASAAGSPSTGMR